ncbi:hypothetical protein KJ654_03615, partial [Patescibacteria group bacterium]|nr:hypothetical protein [Patescibacteria group bacterium]MBU1966983.1 hypothetical protein [Patescibacteria group bacterium]
ILPGFWQGKANIYTKAEKNQPAGKVFQLMKTDFQTIEEKTNLIGESGVRHLRNNDSIALSSSKVEYGVNRQGRLTKKDREWLEKTQT